MASCAEANVVKWMITSSVEDGLLSAENGGHGRSRAKDHRILVTKDSDFVNSFYLKRSPPKLLLVSTGNIDNDALLHLFLANIVRIERAFTENEFVELSRTALILHG
jgi:hypothetical protein